MGGGAGDPITHGPNVEIMMRMSKQFIVFLFMLHTVLAEAQWLSGVDPAFGSGLVTWDHGGNVGSRPSKAFRRSDGYTVVVGHNIDLFNLVTGPFIVMLQPNGQRDLGFGHKGECDYVRLHNNGSWHRQLSTAAMQSDGKVLMMLYAQGTGASQLVRVLPDGHPDPSFGPDGAQDLQGANIVEMQVQPDDAVLLVGSDVNGNHFVRRMLPSGALDTSFGTGGTFSAAGQASFSTLELLADGRILVGGNGLARLNANGTLDASFGTNGWSTVPYVTAFPLINELCELPNGMVLLGKDTGIRRMLPDGNALDAAFTFNNTWPFGAKHIEAVADGSWYFFDYTKLRRCDANDVLDPSFGSFGELDLSLGELHDFEFTESEGIQLYGYMPNTEPYADDAAVERFTADGDPVTSWGRNGRMQFNGNGGNENVSGLAVANDGHIWSVGPGYQAGPMMARFQPDGMHDLGFGYGGAAYPIMNRAIAIGARSDGSALVAGSQLSGNDASPLVFHVLPDGTLDQLWSGNVSATGTTNDYQACADMLVLPDDRALVLLNMGDATNPSPESCAAVMLAPDGQRDLSFGTNGQVLFGWAGVQVSGLAPLPGGGFVCVGTEYMSGEVKLFSFAMDAAGQPLIGFGNDGVSLVTLPQTTFFFTNGRPVVRSDGSYYVLYDDTSQGWLSRLLPDGTLDLTFNNGYYFFQDFLVGKGMGLLSTDELVVSCYEYWGSLPLVKFNVNGALASSFGDGGVYTIADTAAVKFGQSVISVLPGDTVLVAGDLRHTSYWDQDGIDAFLFRFDPDFNVVVPDGDLERDAHFYPNPTSGLVNLRLHPVDEVMEVALHDISGRPALATLTRQDSTLMLSIPPGTASGTYHVSVITRTGVRSGKLVLQH